ncbi:hypothetical protein LTR78_001152 [Recurvomyces mirabilis]|uniref:DUF8035 domain-containing protein n=1 Tax=Recurvomyces mirabilis TaxID=574656 RepID=A0AAE0WVP4_9PEZI|nr:hypothetical protein LTR78_001152 [Recurvomyces mirabilis]KAK5161128.1 hypothetical protein LTS14_000924 [Recurvomyces mirabilis]
MSVHREDQDLMGAAPADAENSVTNTGRTRVHPVEQAMTGEQMQRPKGILKAPTSKFPEHPIEDGVLSIKQNNAKSIPPGARWTKIDRRLVDPEALEEASERFEERLDCVIVLRVLTKEEIQHLADRTLELRDERYEAELASRGTPRGSRSTTHDRDAAPADDESLPKPDDGEPEQQKVFGKASSAQSKPSDQYRPTPLDGIVERHTSPEAGQTHRATFLADDHPNIELQNSYVYTDPASMYANTEPKWCRTETRDKFDRAARGSSLTSVSPSREQPSQSTERARQSARELSTSTYARGWGSVDGAGPPRASAGQLSGPPPSTRGWDRILETSKAKVLVGDLQHAAGKLNVQLRRVMAKSLITIAV